MSDQKSNALTVTCVFAAIAVVGGIVFGSCLRERQWEPKPRVTVEVDVQLSPAQ